MTEGQVQILIAVISVVASLATSWIGLLVKSQIHSLHLDVMNRLENAREKADAKYSLASHSTALEHRIERLEAHAAQFLRHT